MHLGFKPIMSKVRKEICVVTQARKDLKEKYEEYALDMERCVGSMQGPNGCRQCRKINKGLYIENVSQEFSL